MKREYKVEFNRWDVRTYESADDLENDIWDSEVYLEQNRDWMIDSINDEGGFSYGSYSYTPAEILDSFGDLSDVLDEMAYSYIEDIRGGYDDRIEDMDEGETLTIDELGIDVECTKVIPETEEEAEELDRPLPETVEDEFMRLIA